MDLPVVHIGEGDLAKDVHAQIDRVQSGLELIIERDHVPVARVLPAGERRADLPLRSRKALAIYYELSKPSVAYQTNITSPVYRLSELMFGSLLAAYVLGFLGLAVTQVAALQTPLSPNPLVYFNTSHFKPVLDHVLIPLGITLFISIAYAYVTAGMYAIYHAAMLTRESLSLAGLRYDFLLSLLHAVFFGFSLLYPFLFPAFLGLTCLISIWRQGHEFRSLSSHFLEVFYGHHIKKSNYDERDPAALAGKLREYLNDSKYHLLRGWAESSHNFRVITVVLMMIPFVAAAAITIGTGKAEWIWSLTNLVISFLVCVGIIARVHPILGERAGLLYKREMDAMDGQYQQLLTTLFETCHQH